MTPRPAAPGLAREDEHLRILAALRARLHEDALALRTPGEWAARLRLATLMPGEDFANILLISSQRPGATLVRDYRQWTATGRQVRRGENGIEIFRISPRAAPGRPQDRDQRDDDEPPPAWRDADRVAYVWDVSQTTGQPVASPGLPAPGQAPAGLWDALCWLARREGFAVEREDGAPADGTTFWCARRIRLLPGLTGEQAIWALAHQLGHVLLHAAPGGCPPGTTTSGCTGLRKAEADSVAYITCARHGVSPSGELAYPASWAGSDPRTQPAAAILTAGHRIATAATRVIRQTDRILHGDDPAPAPAPRQEPVTPAAGRPRTRTRDDETVSRQAATSATPPAAPRPPGGPGPRTLAVLRDAEAYYTSQLVGSWAPGYLASRGVSDATARDWHIGYAPAGWSTLTGHLRRLGHDDREIQAAGLAKPSSRGTLIDIFRDRIMLPVRDYGGELAGFIGRAHPRAGPDVPKYLNSPETAGYRKGSLLFGLYHARPALAQGATPVLVEGPFDAIAVTIADPGRHAGLAPCGTALTSQQAALIGQAADLDRTGILVAFDSDAAGRNAALRAYGTLRPLTANLQTALLEGKDPAEILQHHGPDALRSILRDRRQPLSALLIDAKIAEWERRLGDLSDPLRQYVAMLNVAMLIAGLLPDEAAGQIRRITAGRELRAFDDQLRHVGNPELPQIARALPAGTAFQAVRTATRLDFDVSDVLTVVANAVILSARSPKGKQRGLRDNPDRTRPAPGRQAPWLASASFPHPPLTPHASAAFAESGSRVRAVDKILRRSPNPAR
jgi:DNA primase